MFHGLNTVRKVQQSARTMLSMFICCCYAHMLLSNACGCVCVQLTVDLLQVLHVIFIPTCALQHSLRQRAAKCLGQSQALHTKTDGALVVLKCVGL